MKIGVDPQSATNSPTPRRHVHSLDTSLRRQTDDTECTCLDAAGSPAPGLGRDLQISILALPLACSVPPPNEPFPRVTQYEICALLSESWGCVRTPLSQCSTLAIPNFLSLNVTNAVRGSPYTKEDREKVPRSVRWNRTDGSVQKTASRVNLVMSGKVPSDGDIVQP